MTQPMNDFIPLAVMGTGRVNMALTHEPMGVIVGVLSLLDNNRPMYFIYCQKHAIVVQHEHKAFDYLRVCLDVRCKYDDIIHYEINVLTNVRW